MGKITQWGPMGLTVAGCFAASFALSYGYATTTTHTVLQQKKAFDREELVVKVGDTVRFTNNDPYYHNIYSLSEGFSFDLGSFGQGEERTITFDQAGEIEVECAIHPSMYMLVIVEE